MKQEAIPDFQPPGPGAWELETTHYMRPMSRFTQQPAGGSPEDGAGTGCSAGDRAHRRGGAAEGQRSLISTAALSGATSTHALPQALNDRPEVRQREQCHEGVGGGCFLDRRGKHFADRVWAQ
jgi:hypothetical protein